MTADALALAGHAWTLADLGDVDAVVWLLPLLAAYAVWRAVAYAKKKRWVIVVPIVFVALVASYEFAVRLWEAWRGTPPAVSDEPGETRGAPREVFLAPPPDDDEPGPP